MSILEYSSISHLNQHKVRPPSKEASLPLTLFLADLSLFHNPFPLAGTWAFVTTCWTRSVNYSVWKQNKKWITEDLDDDNDDDDDDYYFSAISYYYIIVIKIKNTNYHQVNSYNSSVQFTIRLQNTCKITHMVWRWRWGSMGGQDCFFLAAVTTYIGSKGSSNCCLALHPINTWLFSQKWILTTEFSNEFQKK